MGYCAIKNAEIAVSKIKCWLGHSLLSLNIGKTKFLTFTHTPGTMPTVRELGIHKANCEIPEACECSNKIERVETIRYLGILLNEKLNWKGHINYVTKKVRKLIHKFFELRHILSLKILKTIYFSLVQSILTYGIVVWGGAGKTAMCTHSLLPKNIYIENHDV